MNTIRQPGVAGTFYPGDAAELRRAVAGFLADATPPDEDTAPPKAIVVPHAGYVYSGPVAAGAYARLEPLRHTVTRVVLLGPAHRLAFKGLALPGADAMATPLGAVPIDRDAVAAIAHLPQVGELARAHDGEHSLEVHLPFLQMVLADFALVPLVVGDTGFDQVAELLEILWGGPETLIVISSDLSHYHDYHTAMRMDRATSDAIQALDGALIGHDDACGRIPVGGLLQAARRHGLTGRTVDLRNSGDTAGPKDRVVGYGAYLFG